MKIPSLQEALKIAVDLGIPIKYGRRTGEWIAQGADGKRFKINARRKDAPRTLLMLITRAQKETQ
jgi:hypothetical protein